MSRLTKRFWRLASRLGALVPGVALLPGCGGEDAGPTGPAPGQPEPPRSCQARIPEGELQNQASGSSIFGSVVGGEPGLFDPFGDTECGIAGARVCLLGTDLCTETDAAGQYVLGGLPADQEVDISMEKAGSLAILRPLRTGTVPINLRQTRLITSTGAERLRRAVGVDLEDTKGAMVAIALAAGEGIGSVIMPDNVVMTLVPNGPPALYTRGAVEPDGRSLDDLDRELEATRFGGWGLFFNIEPGEHAVRFERGGRPCAQALPGYGYGLDASGNVRTKIVAGYQSVISAFCL
jgi:hypothetical protein